MAELLKGKPVADAILESVATRVSALAQDGVVPTLAIVRVGDRPEDASYERQAIKRCEAAGLKVHQFILEENATTIDLLEVIHSVNNNPEIHGCLLFRPLPTAIDEARICGSLYPAKDIDAIGPLALHEVFSGDGLLFAPCTAEAVLRLLDHYQIPVEGKTVSVVGRSLVIGRPVASLLLARNATVTICHSKTANVEAHCRAADIVVVATGRPNLLGEDAARENADQVFIDVGTNWDEAQGKLVGDLNFDALEPKVASITPVPGGVGAITTAVLVDHVVTAAQRFGRKQ